MRGYREEPGWVGGGVMVVWGKVEAAVGVVRVTLARRQTINVLP